MIFTDEEKKILLELINNEQVIYMFVKDNVNYTSDKYRILETLKLKLVVFISMKMMESRLEMPVLRRKI